MAPDWLRITMNPKSTVGEKPCLCNSGIPRTMNPQSVGDASMTTNPGIITGIVPLDQPIPRVLKNSIFAPQAINPREVRNYQPGNISDVVPIDPRTQMIRYGMV